MIPPSRRKYRLIRFTQGAREGIVSSHILHVIFVDNAVCAIQSGHLEINVRDIYTGSLRGDNLPRLMKPLSSPDDSDRSKPAYVIHPQHQETDIII